MKRYFGIFLTICTLCVLIIPQKAMGSNEFSNPSKVKPTQEFYVNDFADVLSPYHESNIQDISEHLWATTGAQVAVATIPSIGSYDIRDYAYKLATNWGIGSEKENNGVLILLAIEERQSVIEVGYGLEGALTDIITGRIQDTFMIPNYAQDKYSAGLFDGFQAVSKLIYQEYDVSPDTPIDISLDELTKQTSKSILMVSTGGLFIFIFILSIFASKSQTPFVGSYRRGGVGGMINHPYPNHFPRGMHMGGNSGGFGGGGGNFGGGGGFGGGGSSRGF